MSYQTLPIFFQFHPLSSATTTPLLPSSPQKLEMECVEAAALKASLRAEIMASGSWAQDQSSNDDDWSASGAVAGSSGDEFFVDGLFDFSNEDIVGAFVQDENEDEDEEDEDAVKEYGSSAFTSGDENSNSSVSLKDDFDAELSFPTDDLAHLEWLSHFVEDSFTQFPCSSGALPYAPKENTTAAPDKKKSNRTNILGFSMGTLVPAKARTKRERTGGRVWSFRSPQSTESSSSSSSPSLSSTASWPSDSCLILCEAAHNLDHFGRPPSKKKKLAGPVQDRKNPFQQPQRRCSHCLVQKTPQWRNGPLGAKTLCNACGVRYKSGRLFPEYRPAGSPTFLSHVHSNHHRKVLEMRRNKETVPHGKPGLAAAVESF